MPGRRAGARGRLGLGRARPGIRPPGAHATAAAAAGSVRGRGEVERATPARRAQPLPGAGTGASRAQPAPPHPSSRAQEFRAPARALRRGPPLFAWGGGRLAPPGTRRFKPAPISLLLPDGGPLSVAPRALGDPPPTPPREPPAVLGEDGRGSQGPGPNPAEARGWR